MVPRDGIGSRREKPRKTVVLATRPPAFMYHPLYHLSGCAINRPCRLAGVRRCTRD